MPQVYKTYEDFAQELDRPRSYEEGSTPTASSSLVATAAPAQATSGGQAQQPISSSVSTQPTAAKPIEATGGTPTLSILGYTPDVKVSQQYEDLLRPLVGGLQKSAEKLRTAGSQFLTGAGPYRSWEGIQGANLITQALTPDEDRAKDESEMEAARGLVTAEYKGPTGIDQGTVEELQKALVGLQGTGGNLASASGIQGLLGSQYAAHPQEISWDTSRLIKDPRFMGTARTLTNEITGLGVGIDQAQREAAGIAERRQGEEEGIAAAARGQLEEERGKVSSDIQKRIDEANALARAQQEAFSSFQDSGDLAALEAYQPGITETFNTPGRQLYNQGRSELQRILDEQYADIREIPLLSPQVTTHGHKVYGWTSEELEALKGQYDKQQLEALRQRANERQAALASAGFDPSTGSFSELAGGNVAIRQIKGETEPGQYSSIFPMAYGDTTWEPIDTRAYLSMQPGTGATRENLATAGEADRYNRTAQLLDLQDRLQIAATPYEKDQIVAEAGQYLEDEIASLEARRGALNENEQAYLTEAWRARKNYKRAQRRKRWAKAIKIVASLATRGIGNNLLAVTSIR